MTEMPYWLYKYKDCPFSRFIGNAAEFYKNRCRCPN